VLSPVFLFASLALIQQTPATAPPAEAVPATSATRPAAAQVCRTEPVTGSRFGRRVCRNAAQTAEERAASREMLRRLQGARVPDS